MIKMYIEQNHSGNTPDFWEENWENSNFKESTRSCKLNPLRPLFEKYSEPGSLMLEGGCGMGNYLTYYSSRGWRVVGVDFAQRSLKSLHKRQDQLPICGGDVAKLPFADETFDLYYSGGVVEHFEGGAEMALDEARRVLKKDGVLLITVPYQSPLRRVLMPFKKNEWRTVKGAEVDNGQTYAKKHFFQYAYKTSEFEKMLAEADLKVIEKKGCGVLWGLYDIPFLNKNGELEVSGSSENKKNKEIGAVNVEELVKDEPVSLLKRLVVSEDASVPVLGLGVKFMRWASANMMMYVCIRD